MDRGWQTGRPLLICYAPLGDPACSEDVLAIYAEKGVDIVEVGVPTADPYLDGTTVANSMARAMRNPFPAARICEVLEAYADVIRDRLRLVLMGYQDMPFTAFTGVARRKLVHGLIMADVGAAGDSVELTRWLMQEDIKRIGFVDAALSTHLVERARDADGYVMLQSHNGPTGVKESIDPENVERLKKLREARIDLPIALGFGIGSSQQATQAIKLGADGVVVGSACIEAALHGAAALREFIGSLRRAIDAQPLRAAPG